MDAYNICFLKEALYDLEEIVLYIARDSQIDAFRMHDKIIEKTNDLSVFPKRGRLVPDEKMNEAGYRILEINPHIAFYRILDQDIFIYRVIHGAANYPLLHEKISNTFDDADG
jgi:toxin ParE1/3/4